MWFHRESMRTTSRFTLVHCECQKEISEISRFSVDVFKSVNLLMAHLIIRSLSLSFSLSSNSRHVSRLNSDVIRTNGEETIEFSFPSSKRNTPQMTWSVPPSMKNVNNLLLRSYLFTSTPEHDSQSKNSQTRRMTRSLFLCRLCTWNLLLVILLSSFSVSRCFPILRSFSLRSREQVHDVILSFEK